jgi:hypothetical protein
MSKRKTVTPEMKALLAKAVDMNDLAGARAARREIGRSVAASINPPLRQGIMPGNIIGGIFNQVDFDYGRIYEYPLDFLTPGTEKDFVAYTIPNQGALPELHVEGDYVAVPTFEIGSSIDTSMKYARDSDWNVVDRMKKVLRSTIVKKMNDDGFHTLIAAAADRNVLVYDSTANSGQFTKRLISLGKTVMRRNGGGNSTSVGRGKLTDVFLSPELTEDMRNWGIDIIDEITRREIYQADDNSDVVSKVFNVRLHDLDEFGETQEYQNYFLNDLGGSLATGDLELLLGLDLSPDNNDAFLMPIRSDVMVYENEMLALQRRLGYQAIAEAGYAVLDQRRVIALSA